jgi:hypothetical protein
MFRYKKEYLLYVLITLLIFLPIQNFLWAQNSRCKEGGPSGTASFSEVDAQGNITYYLAIGKAESKSKHLCINKKIHCTPHDTRPTTPYIGAIGFVSEPIEFGQFCKKCEKRSTCNECGMYDKVGTRYGSTTAACEKERKYEYKSTLFGERWVYQGTKYNYIHSLNWNCY